jgi:hypothetical protein
MGIDTDQHLKLYSDGNILGTVNPTSGESLSSCCC